MADAIAISMCTIRQGLLSPSDATAYGGGREHQQFATEPQVWWVTVRSLSGHAIETYATTLFPRLGIGHREKNNGVLLLIAQEERQSHRGRLWGWRPSSPAAGAGTVLDRMGQAGDFSTAIQEAYAALAVRSGGLPQCPARCDALAAGGGRCPP